MERIVIGGPSGSGKTTVGRLLAGRLGVGFLDADDFHPPRNVAKMRSGVALDDADRSGWLERLGGELAARDGVVLACSALKRAYRDQLRERAGGLRFVMLSVPRDELQARMAAREHFMPAALLESQLEALELGEDVQVVENTGTVEELVDRLVAGRG